MHILKQRLESLPGKQNNGLACMSRRPASAAQRSVHNLSTRASLPMRSSAMLRFLDMRCGHCPSFKRMKRGAGLLRTNSRTIPPRNPQLWYKQFIAFMTKYLHIPNRGGYRDRTPYPPRFLFIRQAKLPHSVYYSRTGTPMRTRNTRYRYLPPHFLP